MKFGSTFPKFLALFDAVSKICPTLYSLFEIPTVGDLFRKGSKILVRQFSINSPRNSKKTWSEIAREPIGSEQIFTENNRLVPLKEGPFSSL